jgi:hypothetical protein
MSDSFDHDSMLMKPGRDGGPLRVDDHARIPRRKLADGDDALAAQAHVRR